MRLAGIVPESFIDGPGLRFVIFTQGCIHKCPYCHNTETWDLNAGQEFTVKEVLRIIKTHKKNKQGITFSGGEPFLHAAQLCEIAASVRQMGWNVVTYTGFTYEQLMYGETNFHPDKIDKTGMKELIALTDYLIDGKFVNELKDLSLKFRGSSNQRIIDVAASLASNHVVNADF
ncbi:MAG: anaerobic ribonucleoside-triphosphate reductase activating protein [Clostridiales bacterium]|jgi:anaerobic ribonucleoside-triphosphate reductase activating protein|nr:anaerobic ribonucleoside-triphosphate reductase activating protein [Clostridiales bacterium]